MPEGGVAPVVTAGVPGLGAALPPGGSGSDLAAETGNLILARVAFVASARAFANAVRMQHTLALIRCPPLPRRIPPAGTRRL
jgi:hypothetical protein